MFGSWVVKSLAQPLDSAGSWAESASRWDFTFPIYSVPACPEVSVRVKASPLWQADVIQQCKWYLTGTSQAGFLACDPTFRLRSHVPRMVKLSHVTLSIFLTIEDMPHDLNLILTPIWSFLLCIFDVYLNILNIFSFFIVFCFL